MPSPCPICGAAGGELAIEEGGFTALRCPGCGLVHVSPAPPPQAVRQIYEHDAAQTASRQQQAKARDPAAIQHARLLLDLLRPYRAAGRLLELGPGGGLLLREAQAAGFEVLGVEPNPVQAAFIQAEHGLPCVAALDQLPAQARFAVIAQVNVLSHLPDPVAALRAQRALLDPDGVLLLETGNFADLAPRFFPLVARTERFQLPDHLCFYGEASLERLLDLAGLEVLAWRRYSRVPEKVLPRWFSRLGLGGLARRLRHAFKYGLGALAPKRGRPQTWIVLARPAAGPTGGAAPR